MSYVGSGGDNGNKTIFSFVLPTVQNNDVLFLFVSHTNTVTYTTSSAVVSQRIETQNSLLAELSTRTLLATDSGNTFTVTMSGTTKSSVTAAVMRGADTTSPVTSITIDKAVYTTSARPCPAITLAETTDVLNLVAERVSSAATATTSFTAPAGVTKVQDECNVTSGQNDSALGYIAGASGTVGPFAWTATGTTTGGQRIGMTVAINAIGGGSPSPSMAFLKADGTLATIASAKFLNGSGTLFDMPGWVTA